MCRVLSQVLKNPNRILNLENSSPRIVNRKLLSKACDFKTAYYEKEAKLKFHFRINVLKLQ